MRKLLLKLKLILWPPKRGDVYLGDAITFVVGKPVEKILFGMTDVCGKPLFQVVPSDDAYRLTIESVQFGYYRCKAELLVSDNFGIAKEWLTRTQPRRIPKEYFNYLILNGIIKKKQT